MTMKLPQKAGFVATTAEWDALVRIAENLAAQLVQRDAESLKATFDAHEKINQLSGDLYGAQMALAQVQSERDACRDAMIAANDAADLLKSALAQAQQDAHCWATLANSAANERDAARAEVARLTAAIDKLIQAPKNGSGYEGFEKAYDELKALRQPATAQTCRECGHHESEHMKVSSKFAIVACSRMGCDCVKPATAQPLDDDGVCKCGHARGQHRGVCMIFPCKCMEFTAPAQGQE